MLQKRSLSAWWPTRGRRMTGSAINYESLANICKKFPQTLTEFTYISICLIIRRPLVGHQAEKDILATCTLDILEILQIPNITLWLLCRHVYCNLQAGYTVTLIFGVLQPSGLVAANPPGVGALP